MELGRREFVLGAVSCAAGTLLPFKATAAQEKHENDSIMILKYLPGESRARLDSITGRDYRMWKKVRMSELRKGDLFVMADNEIGSENIAAIAAQDPYAMDNGVWRIVCNAISDHGEILPVSMDWPHCGIAMLSGYCWLNRLKGCIFGSSMVGHATFGNTDSMLILPGPRRHLLRTHVHYVRAHNKQC